MRVSPTVKLTYSEDDVIALLRIHAFSKINDYFNKSSCKSKDIEQLSSGDIIITIHDVEPTSHTTSHSVRFTYTDADIIEVVRDKASSAAETFFKSTTQVQVMKIDTEYHAKAASIPTGRVQGVIV